MVTIKMKAFLGAALLSVFCISCRGMDDTEESTVKTSTSYIEKSQIVVNETELSNARDEIMSRGLLPILKEPLPPRNDGITPILEEFSVGLPTFLPLGEWEMTNPHLVTLRIAYTNQRGVNRVIEQIKARPQAFVFADSPYKQHWFYKYKGRYVLLEVIIRGLPVLAGGNN